MVRKLTLPHPVNTQDCSFETKLNMNDNVNKAYRILLLTPEEGPSLETSIFPLSFQVVREPLPFAYHCW